MIEINPNNIQQQTLSRPISIHGIGLHSGVKVSMNLLPAKTDFGIKFYRTDLDSNNILNGNSATFYEWDSQTKVNSTYALSGYNRVEMDGSIALIDEVQNDGLANQDNIQAGNFHSGNVDYARYHGGGIIHIGAGTHDITGVQEAQLAYDLSKAARINNEGNLFSAREALNLSLIHI